MNEQIKSRRCVIWIDDRLLVGAGRPGDQQCVARTTRGKRCRNWVEVGQIASWAEIIVPGWGKLAAYDLSGDYRDVARWLGQRCETHWPDGEDFTEPEWEPFDPAVHGDVKVVPRPVVRQWLEWTRADGVVLCEETVTQD